MFSNNWRYLYLITFITHCFYTYYLFKYFIESPRWLHSKGFKEECIASLTELAIFNRNEEKWYDFKSQNEELINKIGTLFLEEEEEQVDDNRNNENKNYTICIKI